MTNDRMLDYIRKIHGWHFALIGEQTLYDNQKLRRARKAYPLVYSTFPLSVGMIFSVKNGHQVIIEKVLRMGLTGRSKQLGCCYRLQLGSTGGIKRMSRLENSLTSGSVIVYQSSCYVENEN